MQLPPNSPKQPENLTIFRMPNTFGARLLLLLVFLFVFVQILIFQNFNYGFIGIGVGFCILWIVNQFDHQNQKIQDLQQQISDLHLKLQQDLPVNTQQSLADPTLSITPIPRDLAEDEQLIIMAQHTEHTADFSAISQELSASAKQLDRNLDESQLAENKNNENKTGENYQVMTSFLQAGIDWFKGGNSIVRIAIIILLIGVVLLLRFASEYWQLSLSAKMAGVAAGGAALTGLGYYLRQKRFDYAISLQGAGLGILFLVLFSSYHLQALSSVVLAYVALALLLATTLWLALKQNTLFLAFVALSSGFIAPFILSTANKDIPALMAYLFVLNSALAVIALFKPWRILNIIALLLTFGIGGIAIWRYALEEQHFAIGCWVWAIFALYLFMSIRYSQHIAAVHQHLKNIPVVDTTLIFATPFMAFSLYAGLVDSDGYALSIASAVLSAVYLVVGYFIHRKLKQLSILSQCFYGLGFVFLALILPFAFDAYWSSVGWAIHGVAMLYFGWRYQLNGAKYFSALLLVISGLASIVAGIFDEKSLLFASSILMLAYAAAYYLFRARTVTEKEQGEQQLDHLLSSAFLVFSFLAAAFVYDDALSRLQILHEDFSLGLLVWFMLLSALWWWKDRQWSAHWGKVSQIILIFTAAYSLVYQTFLLKNAYLNVQDLALKLEFLWIAVLWSVIFFGAYQSHYWMRKTDLQQGLVQLFTAISLIFMGCVGILWANGDAIYYLSALLPVALLVATLLITKLKVWQSLWMANPIVIAVGLLWLLWISMMAKGIWMLPYFLIFNPIDMLSIIVFALLSYAIKPYLFNHNRSIQLMNAALLLVSGLLLISSILLRMLHHYMAVPYWSIAAWDNSTVQMSLTILWASVALVLTLLASKQAGRYIWMLGIAVLAIVIAKLIFLDLSHSHTLTRIISFIGSGMIMLVMGYFAPLPPKQKEIMASNPSEKTEA